MKILGKNLSFSVDYATKNTKIIFETAADIDCDLEELKDKANLLISIKEYKRKRSLDANSYYWVLVTKLGRILKNSNSEIHNLMLARYGVPFVIDGKIIQTQLPNTEEAEKQARFSEYYHLKPTSEIITDESGEIMRTYIIMKGSHYYNTKEMADLIAGLISECKEVGISERDIATPDEQRILKERYGIVL